MNLDPSASGQVLASCVKRRGGLRGSVVQVTAEAAATARQELDDAVGNIAGSGGEAEAE